MKRFKDKRKVISLSLVGIAYALIVTPLIISNISKQQELRSHADTAQPTPKPIGTLSQTCGIATSDTMLIIDRSGSMKDSIGTGTKISNAITAANNFVDLNAQITNDEIGLVSFSTTATTDSPLTLDHASVKTKISALKANGDTCIQCAIDQANQAIASGARPGMKNAVVLLTDGLANYVEGTNSQVSQATAEQAALTAAANGYKASGTIFFVIGIGNDVNQTFLQKLATSTGGQYYFPPTTDNLTDIYNQISQIIAQGSVSGFVFNDVNKNAQFDTTEQKLSGWTLQLTQQGSTTPTTITTDSTGSFMIPDLCSGNYTLKEVLKPGWAQTVPSDPNGYTFTITNGGAVTNKIFGDIIAPPTPTPTPRPTSTPTPTPTPTPKPTSTPAPTSTPTPTPTPGLSRMAITVQLDGIGNRGDNTNPNDGSLSNKHPLHPTIGADIQVFTLSNQLIASGTGTITYNTTTGNYIGDVPIQRGFPGGQYTIKVKADTYLRKLVNGVQNIVANQDNTITTVSLVAGDVNNDNKLDILDYNSILDCYSDITAASNCASSVKSIESDLNDDGAVNQVDYNLFLRELSTQPGQ